MDSEQIGRIIRPSGRTRYSAMVLRIYHGSAYLRGLICEDQAKLGGITVLPSLVIGDGSFFHLVDIFPVIYSFKLKINLT